jgi:hypothetical protein
MEITWPSAAGRNRRRWGGCVSVLALSLLSSPILARELQPAAAETRAAGTPASARVPRAAASSATTAVTEDDHKATAKIPRKRLRQVLGCWQLDGQERWVITRLDASGAQVTTKPLNGKGRPAFPYRARRAAVPTTLMFDIREGNFGFATAGRFRPTLVVFSQSGSTLQASLYVKRNRRERYTPTGDTATLERCTMHKGRRRARHQQTPPRLQ